MPALAPDGVSPRGALRQLSLSEYEKLRNSGKLTPDDQVELLEGWLVQKMTKNPPHRIATRHVRIALEAVVPTGWYVETQEPIVTGDSEPEPGVAVIRGRTEDYAVQNPPASMVALVVEIADASADQDRELKGRIYARAGIAVYWLVNLSRACVEQYSEPRDGAYSRRQDFAASDSVPLALDGAPLAEIPVATLLP